jgi:hypothetical protein
MFVSQRVKPLDAGVLCAVTVGAGADAMSAARLARVSLVVVGWVTVTVRVAIESVPQAASASVSATAEAMAATGR